MISISQSFHLGVTHASMCCHIWLDFLYEKDNLKQLSDLEMSPLIVKKIVFWIVVEVISPTDLSIGA